MGRFEVIITVRGKLNPFAPHFHIVNGLRADPMVITVQFKDMLRVKRYRIEKDQLLNTKSSD